LLFLDQTGWGHGTSRSCPLPLIAASFRVAAARYRVCLFLDPAAARPVPRRYPYLVSIWITFAEAIFGGALGLMLIFGRHLVAGDYYQALGRLWGPSLRQDQVIGGGALWLIGDLAGLPPRRWCDLTLVGRVGVTSSEISLVTCMNRCYLAG
jgi:Cytochrome c oxidase caa3 assembly factor (Caa3_CtaG)